MRRFSQEQINRLTRDLFGAMNRTSSVTLLRDRDAVLQAIGAALTDEFRREEEREQNVQRRLAGLPKPPARGSKEYDELFVKLMEEEYVREDGTWRIASLRLVRLRVDLLPGGLPDTLPVDATPSPGGAT